MEKKGTFTKVLAIGGTVFAWFPIIAPVLLAAILLISRGEFLFDYLMPAELFPFALAGGGMLLWAAIRARSHRGLIGWSLVAAVALLLGAQALAEVTGLASGATGPGGWQWALVIGVFVAFVLAVIAQGVGGVLLWRDLFRTAILPAKNP